MTTAQIEGRHFEGWRVVGGVFIALMVGAGLGFYNASVILAAATRDLDASVTAASGATTVFFAVSGISGFVLARFIEVTKIRNFYILGGIVGGIALSSLHWVTNVTHLYLFFALFGVAFALSGLLPATTLVARWFTVKRSLALAVATTGLSVGGIVITPFASRLIDSRGLNDAGPTLGLVWFVVITAVALIFIAPAPVPAHEGDGAIEGAAALEGVTFEQARSTRFFRMLTLAYTLVYLAQVGALAHLFNLTEERVDASTAGLAISALALTSVIGRFVGAAIVTKVSPHRLTLVLMAMQAIALVTIAYADSRTTVLLAAALFGSSVGNMLVMQPLLLSEAFGVRDYSRIYALSQLCASVGIASGPFIVGALRDLVDYRFSLLCVAVIDLFGLAALASAGSPTAIEDPTP